MSPALAGKLAPALDSCPFLMNSPASVRRVRRASAIPVIAGAVLSTSLSVAAQGIDASAVAKLSPVFVTATRFSEDPDTLPFGVSVVTARQIAEVGATSINEALIKLLGIPGRVDLNGGGDYTLDLRGFGATADSNQVVIVDGVRLSEADLGGTRMAGIPIESVERIEVVRGSGSVLYGEGATAGVIVITTKGGAGGTRDSGGYAYAAAGGDHLRELRAGATVAAGGFSADVSANRRRSDNHRDNFRSETDGVSVLGQWRTDGLRLGVQFAKDDLDSGLPGSLTLAQYRSNPRQASNPNDRGSIRNERRSVFVEAALAQWQLAADAGWRDKALRSDFSGYIYAYDVDAKTLALRAKRSGRWGDVGHALVLGVDRGTWRRVVPGLYGSVAEQDSTAVYVRDEATLPGGVRLSAGARSESIDKRNSTSPQVIDESEHAWELGALLPVTRTTGLYGRVGRSFRLPNVDEFSYTSGGAELRPQTSRDAELGLRWADAGRRADLRLYRSSLTNEIGFDPAAADPFGGMSGANVNFDDTRRQGVELEASTPVTPALSLSLAGALRRSTFTAGPYDGRDVPLAPERTLSLRANWAPVAGHSVAAGVNRVASQHADFGNTCSIPTYTTLDLRYAYQVDGLELAVGATNVTDRTYYTLAFACAGGQPTAIYPEAGRVVTASARLRF